MEKKNVNAWKILTILEILFIIFLFFLAVEKTNAKSKIQDITIPTAQLDELMKAMENQNAFILCDFQNCIEFTKGG